MEFFVVSALSMGMVALFALVTAVAMTIRGFVLSILWGWFLVPLGLPVISIPLGIGVALIVTFLTAPGKAGKAEEKATAEKLQERMTQVFLGPFIALLIGWVVHQFV